MESFGYGEKGQQERIAFAAVLARAKRGEPGSREALLKELREWVPRVMMASFSHVRDGHAEMFDEVELTVLRWVHENPDLLVEGQHPGTLAWRLCAQTAKQWVRDRRHERKAIRALRKETWSAITPGPPPDADFEIAGSDVARFVARLGEPHRSTLVAELQHRLADGPPLEEALGVSAVAARKRLSRAREMLLRLVREKPEGDGT